MATSCDPTASARVLCRFVRVRFVRRFLHLPAPAHKKKNRSIKPDKTHQNPIKHNLVKEGWLRAKRLRARMVNAKGKAMPGVKRCLIGELSGNSQSTSHGLRVRRFLQQSPLLALSSKFLSPSCAPDLGDIATYFFFIKYFDPISECVLQWRHLGVIWHHTMMPL